MYELGQCYENGVGVEKCIPVAMYWYKMSGEYGHSDATTAYNKLLDDGYTAAYGPGLSFTEYISHTKNWNWWTKILILTILYYIAITVYLIKRSCDPKAYMFKDSIKKPFRELTLSNYLEYAAGLIPVYIFGLLFLR